jgi:cytochrome c oxidase cbb3-type subunit 3
MSSGFRSALVALVVVALGVAALDYDYLTTPAQAQGVAATASHKDTMPARPARALSVAQGPVGPVPGPLGANKVRAQNPYGNDPEALETGRELFVAYNCSGCHGGHAGGGMGPSLRDATWIYGGTSSDIFNSIASGRANGMPAWGPYLSPTSIWQLVAYIQSMRTPQEPEPPR